MTFGFEKYEIPLVRLPLIHGFTCVCSLIVTCANACIPFNRCLVDVGLVRSDDNFRIERPEHMIRYQYCTEMTSVILLTLRFGGKSVKLGMLDRFPPHPLCLYSLSHPPSSSPNLFAANLALLSPPYPFHSPF